MWCSSSSTSSKARTGSLAGASGRAQEAFASASSSLNDLAAADSCEAAPRTSGDSEEEEFSCNGDDTDSQPLEVGCCHVSPQTYCWSMMPCCLPHGASYVGQACSCRGNHTESHYLWHGLIAFGTISMLLLKFYTSAAKHRRPLL